MSAVAATRRPATKKPAYRPHIRIVNRAAGLYTVQSERYTHVLYLVDVVTRTCECEAGQHDFANCTKRPGGVCKHLMAATAWHEAIERSRQAPAPAPSFDELAAAFAALPPADLTFRSASVASPALVARYGGAAALMEAFGS